MGWAKYYEDNLSIYNGRMALCRNSVVELSGKKSGLNNTVAQAICDKKQDYMGTVQHAAASEYTAHNRCRDEIELQLNKELERNDAVKLQLNGWWWCKSKKRWCNTNTTANRRFATIFSSKHSAVIYVITTQNNPVLRSNVIA